MKKVKKMKQLKSTAEQQQTTELILRSLLADQDQSTPTKIESSTKDKAH